MPAAINNHQGAGRRSTRATAATLLGAMAVLAALALSACGSDSDGAKTSTTKADGATTTTTKAAADDIELDGKTFTSTSVLGHDLVDGTEITITFDKGSISVNAGCNSMNSEYEVADGTLSWTGTPMATMMGCEDDRQAQDQWITKLLTDGVEVALEDDLLTLTSGDVAIGLAPPADAPLEGTTWLLESTLLGSSASSIPAGVEQPTLTFNDDGTVEVFAGCNRGSTTVQISEDTITFGPIAMTKMFCEGPAGELEQQVLKVLDGEVTYVLDGTSLALARADDGLVYQAKA